MKNSKNQSRRFVSGIARRGMKFTALCLMALLLLSNLSRTGSAAAGNPDLTFDVYGKVFTDFFGGNDPEFAGGYDEVKAMAIQLDGKIVVAGETESAPDGAESASDRRQHSSTQLTLEVQ
jgi:hypothetical protein